MKIWNWTATPRDYIRVDVTVQNVGTEKIDFRPNPVIIGNNSNQFEQKTYVFDRTFDYSMEIYPDVVKTGSILFAIDDKSNVDLKELIVETGLYESDVKARQLDSNKLLFYNREVILKFDLSNVNIK